MPFNVHERLEALLEQTKLLDQTKTNEENRYQLGTIPEDVVVFGDDIVDDSVLVNEITATESDDDDDVKAKTTSELSKKYKSSSLSSSSSSSIQRDVNYNNSDPIYEQNRNVELLSVQALQSSCLVGGDGGGIDGRLVLSAEALKSFAVNDNRGLRLDDDELQPNVSFPMSTSAFVRGRHVNEGLQLDDDDVDDGDEDKERISDLPM